MGAGEVIDYTEFPYRRLPRDVDTVADTAGGPALSQSSRVLRPGGVMIGIASPPQAAEAQHHRARASAGGDRDQRAAAGA
ncbi:MAG: zinc-binding dehydrogenase [Streptosporangiaceae bacterium]